MKTKRASYPLTSFKAVKQADGTLTGEFEALVAVFGNVDLIGDRVMPGAFAKSLDRWRASGDPIPVIFSHQWDVLDAHVGFVRPEDAEEVDDGLKVRGQMDIAEPFAAKLTRLMDERRIKEWSFAYDVGDEGPGEDKANELREVDLIEVGPTLKGMNPETQLIGVKAVLDAFPDQIVKAIANFFRKTAIASHSTATSTGSWDGPANEARLGNEAAALRSAHAWVDPDGDEDAKASYKFIHHEVSEDGSVGAANVTACSTGIGILNGGRGGTNIPDGDVEGVYNHLARHLRDADQEPPELQAADPEGSKAKAWIELAGSVEQRQRAVGAAVRAWAMGAGGDRVFAWPEATFDDRVIFSFEDDAGVKFFEAGYTIDDDGNVTLGEPREVQIQGTVQPKSRRGRKVGRVLSAKNETKLRDARDLIDGVLSSLSESTDDGKSGDNAEDRTKSGNAEDRLTPDRVMFETDLASIGLDV